MNIDKIKELKLDEATEKFATTLMGEIDGMVKSARRAWLQLLRLRLR